MARRRVEALIALLLVGGVVAAVVIAVLVVRDQPAPPVAAPPPTTQRAEPEVAKDRRLPGALVVKIDNVSAARPHTGIGGANAIVVEPVEGGLTRLLAVYWGKRPSVVGPVRSARETDIELLAQLKRPVLAYSGTASRLRPLLRRADLVLASPELGTPGFFRSGSRRSPHNLYVRPNQLPKTKPVASPLRFGAAPAGGKVTRSHRVSYPAARFDFTWSKTAGRWLVSMNGSRMTSTERGGLSAGTVVVQRVKIVRGQNITDAAGSVSPVARTVGKGKAVVLRNGKSYQATWSRPSADRPTSYTTASGKPLPLDRGTVWVLLVPR
ncbi:MAG: DUF3048 domain-containing protein [Haloechinothrix sp.]